MNLRAILLLAFVIPSFSIQAAPLSGTKTVGPTGNYASLTAAIADLQAQTVGGVLILELQSSYSSSVESFPLVVPSLNGASAVKTVTIRPQTGAVGRSITSSNTVATVNLNGAQFVTFDGRPGGVGTVKQLTIANTSTSGVAVRFINAARINVLKYLTLQGVNTSATSGTVIFSTTSGAKGNDGNTLDTCDIRDGAITPTNALYSLGTTTTTAQNNNGNTVSNCNIFNFYSATADVSGVRLDAGNTDWTITGNSFYQTASRAAVAANVRAIYVNNASGNNFTVTGNFIGGDSPGAAVTSQKWTTTGTAAAYLFQGIRLNVGSTTPSSVQGNTIRNITWTSNSSATALPGIWTGIYMEAGSANLGTVTGDTIGSGTGTGSVAITTSGNGGTTFGIGSSSSGTVAIANNTIGSITTSGSVSSLSASLVGIHVTAGANTIAGNTVGNAAVPSPLTSNLNSLNAATSPTSGSVGQQVTGILSSSSTSTSITGNTVANLFNNYAWDAAEGQIRGIVTSDGVNTITGNTVRNLSTMSRNTRAATAASVLGISQSSTVAGQTVSQNTVHSLSNTVSPISASLQLIGIYYAGSTTSGPNLIARNLVHSLSSATSSVYYGMLFDSGTFTAQNNMVSMGITADGHPIGGAAYLIGIHDAGTTADRNFYHNSVHVGGSDNSFGSTSVVFVSAGVTNARDLRDNIFANARGNSVVGGSSRHYAVQYGGSGLTSNNNLFDAPRGPAAGNMISGGSGPDITSIAAWQAATGQDSLTTATDPLFVNPTGNATTVDLHLQASNPAEGVGVAIAAVTDDFDGQTRSSLTPADIGADAGNFTFIDSVEPSISYPLLSNGTTANRTLTGWATILDNAGTISNGVNAPRLYYKKSTDAEAFGGNSAADNGWKYVTGTTGGSGSYSFTVDYTLINGGSVSVGNTIQYFVFAQDPSNNYTSNPGGASASANPPVQNVQFNPPTVNSYSIGAVLSGGTVTVGGAGSTYPSLSGAGGLFATLNASVLTGNVTAKLTGDTTENGSSVLNVISKNDSPNPLTLTIQPNSATMRTMSGSGASGLIRLNGTQRVTIDGSFGGSGRYLTFRNTNNNGATLTFINDASNNFVRNCVLEGASTDTGVVFFSTGVTTGNDGNTVTGNQIRDLSTAAGVPRSLIYSAGTSDTVANSNNTISSNEMFNFTDFGMVVDDTAWNIIGNVIYQTSPRSTGLFGILLSSTGTNLILGNTVRDLTTSNIAYGIYLSRKQKGTTTVAGNRIWNLGNTVGSTNQVYGIYIDQIVGESVTVANNMIALSSSGSTAQGLHGIEDVSTGSTTTIYNAVLITGTGSAGWDTWAYNQWGYSTATVKNNLFLNLRTGGGNHFAASFPPASTGPLAMDYNVYVGTGLATAGNFFDASDGLGTAGTPVSYAQWRTNVPTDTHSSAGNPGGNYSSAMFIDPATADLHLKPGGNVLVNRKGTPLAGVLTDYDNEPRSATKPYLGADDLEPTNLTLLPNGTLSVLFLGNPGSSYQIQRSTNLLIWDILTTLPAAPDGTLLHLDPSPPTGRAFYRTKGP